MKKIIYFILVVAFYLVCYYYEGNSVKEEYKTYKELKRERRKVKRKNNQITDRKQNGKTTK